LRLLFTPLAILLAVALISACSGDDDGGDPQQTLAVEIGVVQSLSGPAGVYGKSVAQGIDLAVSEINGSGAGVALTINLADDASTVPGGAAAFQTLIDGDVTAIIGPTLSNVALEAMKLAQEAGVPALGATLTAQGVTEIGDYVFRVALTEAVVVPAAIEHADEASSVETAALIFDGSDAFSRSSADAMRQGVEDIDGMVAIEVDVASQPLDAALPLLREADPDAFLITPLVNQAAEIVATLRANGFDQVIVGGNSFNTLAISGTAGDAVEGAFVGAAWNPAVDTEASRRFVSAYTAKYGAAPDLFAAQGYSSVYLLVDAVKRAGSTDPAALRDALAATSGVETPLGDISMSGHREAEHEPVVQRFEGGELVLVP
jgi:branched-chain amino acid transport system substrate-binding protein